ncbi:hypothetical protein L227DRAFT_435578 [Lentinus tigrinus ALCF2SS1-6]|uniref:Uncharacterized protein n=1 Tax=Lentinus tigrinus ALCF2SS1-6 TaxID=1328759 RepID=A0A5C2SHI5_9APHY|nr:hypothetical protein L227DRAFT_435578 [Lentinus tigrinus ALCF2SS1-6]
MPPAPGIGSGLPIWGRRAPRRGWPLSMPDRLRQGGATTTPRIASRCCPPPSRTEALRPSLRPPTRSLSGSLHYRTPRSPNPPCSPTRNAVMSPRAHTHETLPALYMAATQKQLRTAAGGANEKSIVASILLPPGRIWNALCTSQAAGVRHARSGAPA